MNYKFIIPECYGDTALIECLGFEDPNHQKGIGNVKKVLNKDFNDKKAICIIDNDKNLGRVFPGLAVKEEGKNLKLAISSNGLHHFIVIKPALEKWLLNCASLASIDPLIDYNIPKDFKKLASLIKTKEVDQNQDFINFLKALVKTNPEPIATLKSSHVTLHSLFKYVSVLSPLRGFGNRRLYSCYNHITPSGLFAD